MFDSVGLRELDAAATSELTAQLYAEMVQRETHLLQVAAHWADLHPAAALSVEPGRPGRERARRLGGAGNPEVCEFAAAEFGPLLETTSGGGANLIGDALDLRHRLPRLWARVVDGQVRSWKARKVAQATRHLSQAAAEEVDAAVAGYLTALSWARFEVLLEAQVAAADPAQAERRAAYAEATRFVRAGRTTEDGLKVLVAKAAAGEVIWFLATVNRIADILQAEGDPDPVDVRRSKAIGILAQPARASPLLWDHRGDPDPRGEPPDDDDVPADGQAPPCTADGADGAADASTQNGSPEGVEDASVAQRSAQAPSAPGGNPASFQRPGRCGLELRPPLLVDPVKLRPPVTLYVHLSAEALTAGTGVARMEEVGPLTLGQVRRFLGDGCAVRVQPVIDLTDPVAPVDGYEVPRRMREIVRLRNPADIFPYAASTSRRQDADHTVPYLPPDRGGPPGQTGLHNLALKSRFHHRVKTHGRWRQRHPEPGVYLWRSPTGWVYLVDAKGTHNLGQHPFAQAIWRAAENPPTPPPPEKSLLEAAIRIVLHHEATRDRPSVPA